MYVHGNADGARVAWNLRRERTLAAVVQKLRPHMARFRRIYVHLPAIHLDRLFSPQENGLPRLEHLDICVMSSKNTVSFDLSVCPRLSTLKGSSGGVPLRFHGERNVVTSINMELDLRHALELLRCCLRVTSCSLRIISGSIIDEGPILGLPDLTELRITLFTYSELSEFVKLLAQLSLPLLKILTIEVVCPPDPYDVPHLWPPLELSDLLHRSKSPLSELTMRSQYFSGTRLIRCLQNAPDLRSLVINDFRPTEFFWHALRVCNDTSPENPHLNLCLNLTKLEITGCTDLRFRRDLVAGMMSSRGMEVLVESDPEYVISCDDGYYDFRIEARFDDYGLVEPYFG